MNSEFRLWLRTIIFSSILFFIFSFYLFLRRGEFDLHIANEVFASSGLVLIGLSFALSGLCYFWDVLDKQIIYRKYLGPAGFALVLVHVIISMFFLSHPFPSYFLASQNLLPFIFGLLALFIFTIMALISNNWAIKKLGGTRWRKIMHLGYLAFLFVLVHFGLIKYSEWLKWFKTTTPLLPPLSLLVFVFGLAVIFLRLSLFFSKKHQQ